MKFIFEAINSMFARLTALIDFRKIGRSGRSAVKFGALPVAFGLLLGLILVGCDPASSGGASGNGLMMPMGMTIDETTDCVVGTATACTFAVGDMFTGEVGGTDDPSDWVKVTLLEDTSYRITATPGTAGTTADLHIHIDGNTPETAADPDIGNDNLYTATTATVHYIEIGLSVAGGYELTIALAPEGENICNSMDAEGDCDKDSVPNQTDEFEHDAAKSCTVTVDNGTLDCDNDGHNNLLDNCPAVANPLQTNSDSDHATNSDTLGDACDPDRDGDSVNDDMDVDDDNDGLIELATETELNNIRYNHAGTNYKTAAGAAGLTTGAPAAATTTCTTDTDADGTFLCGYELANDIMLTADGFANWIPVGSGANRFTAIFEGNGYAISGLAIVSSSGDRIGFFSHAGLVRNLHIAGNIMHSATSASIGGLAVTVTNIFNSGAAVSITNSVDGNGRRAIGGLMGVSAGGTAKNSWAAGNVTVTAGGGSGYILGGLIGDDTHGSGSYADVYATGTVMGDNETNRLGGLFGRLVTIAPLTNSYATGDVTGGTAADTIGGLVGESFDGVNLGAPLTAVRNGYHRMGSTVVGAGDTNRMFIGRTGQTPPDISAQTEVMLQTPTANTGIYSNWSTDNWNFGTASQLPALKFAEHSAGQDPDTPDCTPTTATGSTFDALPLRPSALAQPYCGKLLPMQPGR